MGLTGILPKLHKDAQLFIMTLTKTDIEAAVAILKAGGVVGLPTETVYGLAGDASNPTAIARIYAAKKRPADNPLIVHIESAEKLTQWACDIPKEAYILAEAFWPGPLTLILKKQPWVQDAVTAGQPTVGLRVPSHPVALAVLKAFGGGLAAPSANLFTEVSPTHARAVKEALGDRVELVLEGGDCEVGLESTILDLSGDAPQILRPGMISVEAIEAVLGCKVLTRPQNNIKVPGQYRVHYAPHTKVVWVQAEALNTDCEAVITHTEGLSLPQGVLEYHLSSDPKIYAQKIYRILRELDVMGLKQIGIEVLPPTLEWDAIRDRLNKAASRSET